MFPRLLSDMSIVGRNLVKSWFFNNPDSVPYMLDSVGLAFLGLSTIAIGAGLVQGEKLERAMGCLLILSGVTALAGFAGYAIDSLRLESVSVVSGLLTVPFAFLAVLHGLGEIRSRRALTGSL
jgi:hypothetical protein